MADIAESLEITHAIEHESFLERNQFALEIIRIRKLINLVGRVRAETAEEGEKMSSIIHTFLIISLIHLRSSTNI